MKTLVVLAAFAAVALAAPAFEQEGFKKAYTNIPETYKRERKSALGGLDSPAPDTPVNLPSTPQVTEFGVSGRSFGLKKPIIIKKKAVGYQVYRDSDEVPVDSQETCGSHVKVKFCDGKAKMKSATTIEDNDNTQITEEDMKQTITLAKEALEHIQRDLNIVERKPGNQASSWNHGHSASDVELHQDIEVAREALEHINKNFGNLESMSLQATTLKNAENVPSSSILTNTKTEEQRSEIAKTEEQRLAQWKEAMHNIQKNVEIAKNIEDSFRETSNEAGLFSDATMINDSTHELNKKLDHKLRTSEDGMTKTEHKIDSESCKTEHVQEKSSENDNIKDGQIIENDMASSASTMSEKKAEDSQNFEKTRHTSELLSENEEDKLLKTEKSLEITPKEKDADVETMASQELAPKNDMVSESLKTAEDNKEENVENTPLNKSVVDSVPALTNEMKSVETEDLVIEDQKKAAKPMNKLEKIETEMKAVKNFENKKEDQTHADLLTDQSENIETALLQKSAEEIAASTQKQVEAESEVQEIELNKELIEKHLSEAKMDINEDMKQKQEMVAPINHAEQIQFHQRTQAFPHPEMRSAEDFNTMQQNQLMNPDTRWAHDKNLQLQREAMTSTDSIHSQRLDHVHTVQHPGHRHHIAHGMKSHHFEVPSGHEQLRPRFSNNFMSQGKSADQEMQAYYMGMRDSGLGPESQRFRWKPTHERTAYGAPAPTAPANPTGAVGVFPSANLGGCGIPLLLSCNPSVVSGSLSKSPPPYSAPAYRTEDDFNFLTKRDVKKTHENLPSHLNRTPKANLKTSTVLVAK